jgi:protein-S-isoprenylcysteine O-methyltransferase Ste14
MAKILMALYAVASYGCFVAIFLLLVGFVGDAPLPKTIDRGTQGPLAWAVVCNVLLISLFGLQHSVMARPAFKRWWTRLVPAPIERSTYVLIASLLLGLVMWQWRPIPEPVLWDIQQASARTAIVALFWAGWEVILASTCMINHFELFGLRQACTHLMGRQLPAQPFRTPLLYRRIRHPIYLGFLIAFWAAPRMTLGHLLFGLVWTAYILVGICFEERDLLAQFGARYLRYREQAGMLFPSLGKRER